MNVSFGLQCFPTSHRFAVILVDPVVNSGRTILGLFVRHIRDFNKDVSVGVITGVMQAECVSGGRLTAALAEYINLQSITLRTSENKYKGTGATDTGNRLFNTLHLTLIFSLVCFSFDLLVLLNPIRTSLDFTLVKQIDSNVIF